MGKKSSEKKNRKVEPHVEQHQKKPHVQPVVHTNIPPIEKKKLEIPFQKIAGVFLAVVILLTLFIVGATLLRKAFSAVPLAEILPAEKTAALFEINTNPDHTQLVQAKNILAKSNYSFEKTLKAIEDKFEVNFETDIKPWLGRNVGIAEIIPDPAVGNLATVYFVEAFSKKGAENFIQKIKGLEKTGAGIYKFELKKSKEIIFVSFLEEYLMISSSEAAIKSLTLTGSQSLKKLSESEEYARAKENLPLNKIANLFVDFEKAPEKLLQKYGLLDESSILTSMIRPFVNLFSAESFWLMAGSENFIVKSYSNLKSSYLKGNGYLTHKDQYTPDLTAYIPDDVMVFWGGQDLEKQTKRMVEVLGQGGESVGTVFEEVLGNYTEKYFGNTVSLEEDIYPLVTNEFALGVTKKNDKNLYTLVLELKNPAEDALRLQKLANNFISAGAVFEPRVEEHELPDGTKTREIVASPSEIIKSEIPCKDKVINAMETPDGKWGIYYVATNSIAILSTDKEAIRKSLSLEEGESVKSLKNSSIYATHILPMAGNSDEVSYFDISKLWPASNLVKSLSTGKEYFSDGVMTHYFIYVE